MIRLDISFFRLRDSVSRFIRPAAAPRDIRALKVQIELRRQALREIEVIRRQLRPYMQSENRRLHGRLLRGRYVSRPRLTDLSSAEHIHRPY